MLQAVQSLLSLVVVGIVYLLPSITAYGRERHFYWIAALNLFLGWTGFGWMAALVWAISPAGESLPVDRSVAGHI